VHCQGDRILGLTLHHKTRLICLMVTLLMLLLAASAAFAAVNLDDVIALGVTTFSATQIVAKAIREQLTCVLGVLPG